MKVPTLSASAGRGNLETDGKILLNGSGLTASQEYYVGIYTTGEAHKIGSITTGTDGAINNASVEYPCGTPGPNAIRAGIYQKNSTNLGAGIVSAAISGSTCMP